MKALARGALSAVLALGMCGIAGPPAQAADTLVDVPDAALRSCIQTALTDTGPTTELTEANLAGIDQVVCPSSKPVADLTGAEHLLGLTKLVLSGATVTDIAPLAGLQDLSYLWVISENGFALEPLASLPSLTSLGVSIPAGVDTAPVARLSKLERLFVETDETQFPAVQVPASVWYLALRGDQLTHAPAVTGGDGVTRLSVGADKVTSLRGIETLSGVTDLFVYARALTDISALAPMTRIASLYIGNGLVTDLAPLSGLSHLVDLTIGGNQVEDLGPLSGLASLKNLSVRGNQVRDLTPLARLTALTSLDISANHIADLSPLPALAQLESFNAAQNEISDLGPLREAAANATFTLSGNHLKDLSPLPDTAHVYADGQTVSFSPTATVGTAVDLGIRGVVGDPICPAFSPQAVCAAGVVTYPVSRTYTATVSGRADGLSFSFTQHAGPDRIFTSTPSPVIDTDLYVGYSTSLRIPAWSPQVDHFTYEWFKDGAPIPGADPDYADLITTIADIGHRFSVCVTGHSDGVVPARRCSNTAKVVSGLLLYPSYPPIEGSPVTDSVLSVDSRFWTPGVTLSYRWQKNHRNIRGATAATYRVRAGDVGDSIRAIVTGTKQGYGSKTVYSHTVRPKKAVFTAPVPVITGVATVGQRLAVTPGAWVPASGHLSYRWYRNGKAISQATKATYRLKAKDRGKLIKVRVSATRAGYVTKRVYSLPTARVA